MVVEEKVNVDLKVLGLKDVKAVAKAIVNIGKQSSHASRHVQNLVERFGHLEKSEFGRLEGSKKSRRRYTVAGKGGDISYREFLTLTGSKGGSREGESPISEPNVAKMKQARGIIVDLADDIDFVNERWEELQSNAQEYSDILVKAFEVSKNEALAIVKEMADIGDAIEALAFERSQLAGVEEELNQAEMKQRQEKIAVINKEIELHQALQREKARELRDVNTSTKIMKEQINLTKKSLTQDKNRIHALTQLARHYRWFQSLILVTLNFLRVIAGQIAVLASMMSMIGAGLGYILDMILLPMLDLVILLLDGLIWVGDQIDRLNEDYPLPIIGGLGSLLGIIGLLLMATPALGYILRWVYNGLGIVWAGLVKFGGWFAKTFIGAWLIGSLKALKVNVIAISKIIHATIAAHLLGLKTKILGLPIVAKLSAALLFKIFAGLLLGLLVVWALWRTGVLNIIGEIGKYMGEVIHNAARYWRHTLDGLVNALKAFAYEGFMAGGDFMNRLLEGAQSILNRAGLGRYIQLTGYSVDTGYYQAMANAHRLASEVDHAYAQSYTARGLPDFAIGDWIDTHWNPGALIPEFLRDGGETHGGDIYHTEVTINYNDVEATALQSELDTIDGEVRKLLGKIDSLDDKIKRTV